MRDIFATIVIVLGIAAIATAVASMFMWAFRSWLEYREREDSRREQYFKEVVVGTIAQAWERQDKYLLEVLDRFQSRTFEERAMVGMIRGEVQVDQDDDQGIDSVDDDVVDARNWADQMDRKMKEAEASDVEAPAKAEA